MKKEIERFQALYLLNEGQSPMDISENLNCSYSSVLRWKRELENARADGTAKQLLLCPAEFTDQMSEFIVQYSNDISKQVDTVVKLQSPTQQLNEDLVKTAATLDRRIRTMALGAESTSEILDLTACLVKLKESFLKDVPVAAPVTTNTEAGTQAYGALLSDKPAV